MTNVSLSAGLRAVLSGGGANHAIQFGERWYSWSELHETWQAVEALLDSAGVPMDAALAFVARSRVQHAAVILGAFSGERTLSMIYALQSPTVIARDITGLNAAAVIADRDDWTPEAIAAARGAGSAGISISSAGRNIRVELVAGLERAGPGPHRPAGGHDIEVLSSGTTGTPKRVRLPVQAFTRAVASMTLGDDSQSAEVSVLPFPFSSIGGLLGLTGGAWLRQRMVLLEKFSVEKYVEAVRTYKIKSMGVSGSMYRLILAAKVPRESLASLEYAFGGSEPLEPEVMKTFEETYGVPLLWGYGATEYAGTVLAWTPALRKEFGLAKQGSVGRPLAGAEVRVIDEDTGREVPRGAQGNLEVRVDVLGPDWIRSTDLAVMDEDGFVFLHGRGDRAINRGGFKVLPERVAEALRLHPAVLDAAVIGLTDPILGQVPVAVVECRPDTAAPAAEELQQVVRDNLPSHHVPKRVLVVDRLPRTASLKVELANLHKLFE